MDRVGSEGVSRAAAQALSCTKQATMGGGQAGNEEENEEFCHLPLAHLLPSSCRMSFFQPNSKTSGPSISSHRMQLSLRSVSVSDPAGPAK